MRSPLFILLALLLVLAPARAGERLWVGLYVGENRVGNPPPPTHPSTFNTVPLAPDLTSRLQQVFGFTHYKLLKGEDVILIHNWDHWVMSRKDFFLRIRPLPHGPDEPAKIGYEIYKDGFIVANGVYIVKQDTPLFISGPDFHRGRLIFVLQAR